MSYVRKLMAPEEKLIGIARLHWIYVLKGILWFAILASAGWMFNSMMTRMLFAIGDTINNASLPSMLVSLNNGVLLFMMGGGFLVFLLFVLDVLTTEIGLTDRRVMHKKNLLFIKVKQIDLEEIRGENVDLGWFGRILGYGYLLLDCRFIGDIRLPAIENPERFMRALHDVRGKTQDTLNVVVGKGKAPYNLNIIDDPERADAPQPEVPKPTPEIQPGQEPNHPEVHPDQTPSRPEIQPPPVPHGPPATPQPAPPEQPTPPPIQPIPTPGPDPRPPLQPPSGEWPPGQVPLVAQSVELDPQAVAQIVKQVMPQMAEQVVRQLAQQGVLEKPAPENDNEIDNNLIAVFDDARFKDPDPHELHDKMEHVVH